MISTTITWAPIPTGLSAGFSADLTALVASMKQQGVTDGVLTQTGPETYVRVWADQASADTFIAAVRQLSTKYNRAIVSYVTNAV